MTSDAYTYEGFLRTLAAEQWKRIGITRRSGVVVPLFSVYSSKSCGIGEFPDLKRLADWCCATGMSMIQLLPMNDVGFTFRPYDALSSFALEPMYLSLEEIRQADLKCFAPEIQRLKTEFPTGASRVNYGIKAAKLGLLWHIFQSVKPLHLETFEAFSQKQRFWLDDYALFKVIKERQREQGWEAWPQDLKGRDADALARFRGDNREQILFQKWLQWQCHEQFAAAKKHASSKGVLLMGDIPFLVSRDSADVWSHQEYFKLELSAGAPPDMLYAEGQRWGMPPYNWDTIAKHGYDYIKEKLRFAENFYDLYRIDHVVGIFRVWSIPNSEPVEKGGLNGFFDPREEHVWEKQGRELLSMMIKSTRMLACAEDLGTIPLCAFKVLEEFGIPGIDIQRWSKEWGRTYDFKKPSDYRRTALATLGTHDMSCFFAWWRFEAGTVDEVLMERKCHERNLDFGRLKDGLFDRQASRYGRLRWKPEIHSVPVLLKTLGLEEHQAKDFIDLYHGSYDERARFLKFLGLGPDIPNPPLSFLLNTALERIAQTSCIFTTQLLQDWLSLDVLFTTDPWELRVNFPGTVDEKNWSLVLPMTIDDMLVLPVNSVIKQIQILGRRQ